MNEPWYKDGLRFECHRCGNCCTGAGGTVRVTDEEAEALAVRLQLETPEFRRRYTRELDDGDTSLTEKPNGDCVFYDASVGCTVYEDRPRQCRTWPFWRDVVRTRRTWAREARRCCGMNHGKLYTLEMIEESIAADGTSACS